MAPDIMKTATPARNKRKAVLAGGSGFLGLNLAAALADTGWEVVVLTRHPKPARLRIPTRQVVWDGRTLGPWVEELEGADALVNLTGKRVDCRPTARNREAIHNSRVRSVEVLGRALRACNNPPTTWIQCSSAAIYGNAGDRLCTESAHVPRGYPMDVCVAWEEALGRALLPEMRHVILRISFVLSAQNGALPVLARLTRWGLGGAIGTGKQWISWIHEDDMTRIFLEAIENPQWHGVINATGLEAETNRNFMRRLRHTLKRPWSPTLPAFIARIGGWLVGSDPELALTGRRVSPTRLTKLGFQCRHRSLDQALNRLLLHDPQT